MSLSANLGLFIERIPSALLGTLLAIGIMNAGHARAGDKDIDQGWLQKVRTEGKAAYEKYVAVAGKIDSEYEIQSRKIAGGGTSGAFQAHSERIRFVFLDGNGLLDRARTYERDPSHPQLKVICQNKDYCFELTRQNESAGYALARYFPGHKNHFLQGMNVPEMAFGRLGSALNHLEKPDEYKLDRVRWDEMKALLNIKISFTGAGSASVTEDLWLDPAHDWRVVQYSTETPHVTGVTRVTYGETIGGVTFPTGFTDTYSYKGTDAKYPANFELIGHLKSIKVADAKEADFRLSAFGLPEPAEFPQKKAMPMYLWFLLGAGVFALLALVFRRLARRGHQATTGPGPTPVVT